MTIDIDALIKRQQDYLESIQPVDVEVTLGEQIVNIRVPFIMPSEFNDLADHHPPRPGVQADLPLWFSLHDTTRAYPNVTIIVGDEEDDLFVIRDKEAFYRWGEVYDALEPEDQANVRMAVWALHVWEPQQRKAKGAQNG